MKILKTAEFYKVDAKPDTQTFVNNFIKSKNKAAANDAVTITHEAEGSAISLTDNQKFDAIASEVMANRKSTKGDK